MENKTGLSEKLETAYLKIFKVVILVVLTVALLASIGLALKGWSDMSASREEPPAAKQPKVDVEEFLKSLTKPPEPAKKADSKAPPKSASSAADKAAQEKRLRDMATRHLKLAQDHLRSCRDGVRINQEDAWISGRIAWLRGTLNEETQGDPAVVQFDSFYALVVPHKDAVAWCTSNIQRILDGQVQAIPYFTTKFFDASWERQFKSEQSRIEKFNRAEQSRVATAQARSLMEFYAAGVSFLVFMLLSLILIFARIESNLRGIQLPRSP